MVVPDYGHIASLGGRSSRAGFMTTKYLSRPHGTVVPADDANADRVEVGVEDVLSMPLGFHPADVQFLDGVRTFGNVLSVAPAETRVFTVGVWRVLIIAGGNHVFRPLLREFGQLFVPGQRGQSVRCPFLIDALVDVASKVFAGTGGFPADALRFFRVQ